MITCHLRYVLDPFKLDEFEHYGKLWIHLVAKFGGTHQGYFLPSEGANNIALAMFTFPSFASYEDYREKSLRDPECQAAFTYAEETGSSSATNAASSVLSSNDADRETALPSL